MLTRQSPSMRYQGVSKPAFTLIELLVVVAIIALLVAILLPSLNSARAHAKTAMCGANLHSVGLAVADYLFGSKGTYPAAYAYPYNKEGDWDPKKQPEDIGFGYLHWSYFMFDEGKTGDKMFQCPTMENGGAPRTNPGRNPSDWGDPTLQVDHKGAGPKANETLEPEYKDKQATRMAYTANAAIMPRNKFFEPQVQGRPRANRFVKESQITRLASTILVSEFFDDWRALGEVAGGSEQIKSKSHRPVSVFWHQGAGFEEYAAPANTPGFQYGETNQQDTYGLAETKNLRGEILRGALDSEHTGIAMINALGRHHPNPNKSYARTYGGLTQFMFGDGHVETLTILDTMERRLWGDAYYSLTGENKIMNMTKINTN